MVLVSGRCLCAGKFFRYQHLQAAAVPGSPSFAHDPICRVPCVRPGAGNVPAQRSANVTNSDPGLAIARGVPLVLLPVCEVESAKERWYVSKEVCEKQRRGRLTDIDGAEENIAD